MAVKPIHRELLPRLLGAAVLAVMPWMTTLAHGQGVELRLNPLTPSPVVADPGEVIALTLEVTNTTGRPLQLREELELPEGWRPIVPASGFTLEAGAHTTRLFAIEAAAEAQPGGYPILVRIADSSGAGLAVGHEFSVLLSARLALAFVLQEQPAGVLAGEAYDVQAVLRNQGNEVLTVRLEASVARERYGVIIEPTRAVIEPGEHLPVVAHVTTDPDETVADPHFIKLRAEGRTLENATVATELNVRTDVIPTVRGESSARVTYPATATLRAVGRDNEIAAQMILAGKGPLDELGRQWLDFRLRAPDLSDEGPYGWDDEYWARYVTDTFTLRAGDQAYRLSELTSRGLTGRGLGFDWHGDADWTGGAFFERTPGSSGSRDVAGAYLSQAVAEDATLRFNLMRARHAEGSGASDADIVWSLEGDWLPSEDLKFEGEYARGDQGESDAYRLGASGSVNDLRYALRHTHADPDFAGAVQDVEYTHGSLVYPFSERWSARGSFSTLTRNLARDPARGTALHEDNLQAYLQYRVDDEWSLLAGWDQRSMHDRLLADSLLSEFGAVVLGIRYTNDHAHVSVEMRDGKMDEGALTPAHREQAYRLLGSVALSEDAHLSAHYSQHTGDDAHVLRGGSDQMGATLNWTPSEDLTLSARYNAYNLDPHAERIDEGELTARYTSADATSWELRYLARSGGLGDDQTAWMLSYTIPLDVPLGRRANLAALEGRITEQSASGESTPLPDVVVTVAGVAAVTDREGRFKFGALEPGMHLVQIDRRSLGLERIPLAESRLVIECRPGEDTALDIPVVQAASLTGTLAYGQLEEDEVDPALTRRTGVLYGDPLTGPREGGIANVLIELSNGTQTLRQVTDNQGAFTFERLAPGEWTLTVLATDLPEFYEVGAGVQELPLAIGEARTIELTAWPQERHVRFVVAKQ